MTSLRIPGRRAAAGPAAALLLGLALTAPAMLTVAAPAAFAAGDVQARTVDLPKPLYEASSAALSRAETCKAFERRFDHSLAGHAQAAKVDEGKALRIEGAKLCGDGDYAMGTQKLGEALDDIGVSSKL